MQSSESGQQGKKPDEYHEFLETKKVGIQPSGAEAGYIPEALFDFQTAIVRWAVRRGRAAIFADCGLGKTLMQLAWAANVPGDVLILAPLAVAAQTAREGEAFGIDVTVARTQKDCKPGINVTNYEMLDAFDAGAFAGVVLDESSILKSYTGAYRTAIIDRFRETRWKLACTATPAPNDHIELGNHAEFLGIMSRVEMLAMFFTHDGGSTQNWRLKGHGERRFWEWMCSWAVSLRNPSDVGFVDDRFQLPPIRYVDHVVEASVRPPDGHLFDHESPSLINRRRARSDSVHERAEKAAEIVGMEPDQQWILWCDLNAESEALARAIPGSVEIRGSDSKQHKEDSMLGFASGKIRVLVTKPSIAGFGMNWQNCARMAFVGLSDSYEALYQATRRCWRFGQCRQVDVHIVTASTEGAVLANIKKKEKDAEKMSSAMVAAMTEITNKDIGGLRRDGAAYMRDSASGEGWSAILGDCVEVASEMEDCSIDYSVFSPPFASLYTYSNSERDMGNCKDNASFGQHFAFAVHQLHRILKPGRLVSFHCMNLPTSKARDGVIGIRDFRGEMIRLFEAEGFIFHSEVCIWKDPVTAMQRTKALGLLHKQIRKDSAMSRQGIPDYVVTMRKLGENAEPIAHSKEEFPVSLWQKWASPVWDDINPSDTLEFRSARENNDEKHIAPLQLEVIRRCIGLWTNKGDIVFSPFMGIGSEGYVAIRNGRRFVGAELKASYFSRAVKHLEMAEMEEKTNTLFEAGLGT